MTPVSREELQEFLRVLRAGTSGAEEEWLERLVATCMRGLEDTERLDWLSESPHDVGGFVGMEAAKFWGFYGKQSQSLREIVDEARAYQRGLKENRT